MKSGDLNIIGTFLNSIVTAFNNHKDAITGVHGVGSGDSIAKESELTNKLDVNGDASNLTGRPKVKIINPLSYPYDLIDGDEYVRATGTVSINLPPTEGLGRMYRVKNIGTGIVTIQTASGDSVDGESFKTISVQYQSLTFVDGAIGMWEII